VPVLDGDWKDKTNNISKLSVFKEVVIRNPVAPVPNHLSTPQN